MPATLHDNPELSRFEMDDDAFWQWRTIGSRTT